ncbi:hypothetical protein [Pseudooceanicola sp. LIPI14-2-Ac024]|uniref:hypothetical protein n=1 Tax=Pseudooceanicola sp. LIPI14-2-Ac024 TaxID=3344875 RepID=UPI0035CF093C
MTRAIIFSILVNHVAPMASAQITQPLPCSDYYGRQVLYVPNPSLPDIGQATVWNGQPTIFINPNILIQFSPIVQQWWYAHECQHHALGLGSHTEAQADCFAGRALAQLGILSSLADTAQLKFELSNLPGNQLSGHLPGTVRGAIVEQCAREQGNF